MDLDLNDHPFPTNSDCDLNNDIHTIFARSRFAQDIDCEMLAPALRLASHFITAPCLLDLWYAILRPNYRDLECSEPDLASYTYRAWFRKETPLTSKDLAYTKYHLTWLADGVRFYRHTFSDGVDGQCIRSHASYSKVIVAVHRWDILISEKRYQAIKELYTGNTLRTKGIWSMELLRHYLSLASLLVHELAHVAEMSTYGNACAFEDQAVSEVGFDWENVIFGGKLEQNAECITEWPNGSTAEAYLRNGIEGLCCSKPFPDRVYKIWFIPERFVRKLFQTSFWTRTVPGSGAKTLKVPQILGYRVKRLSCECCPCRRIEAILAGGNGTSLPCGGDQCNACWTSCTSEWVPFSSANGDPASEPENVPEGYSVLDDGTLVVSQVKSLFLSLKKPYEEAKC